MKSIAILLPAFNSAETLPAALRSILDLDKDLADHIDHLMFCDDGSTDGSIAVAERIWNHRQVPLVVRRAPANRGEFGNVNAGIDAMPAHVRWALIMHSDNEALPAWIRVLARECERADDKVAIIAGSWEFVSDGKTTDAGDSRGVIEDVAGDEESIRSTLLAGCWWHNGASAVRISAWKAIGGHPFDTSTEQPMEVLGFRSGRRGPPIRQKGDWDTLLRCLSSGYSVRYVATPLVRYIDNRDGLSTDAFSTHRDLIETLQVMRRHQSVLSPVDILAIHGMVAKGLLWRMATSIVRRHWQRTLAAMRGLLFVAPSLVSSMRTAARRRGGTLQRIPFRY